MAKLSVTIVGQDLLSAALDKAAASAEGFGARIASAGRSISSFGETMSTHLTLPIVAAGAGAADLATKFQSSMELLHTQAGVSQAAVESLSKSVLAMAGPVATAPEELATGLYHITSQGLRGAKALDALRVAAEGAKVGQANLEDVTNALGAVLVSHIGGFSSYGQAMGQLNAIVGAGDMHMQDLADAMGTGLPAKAAIAGVSLQDVGAALAVFGDNNIRGAQAGTLLNSTMRLMEGPSKAAAKAMAAIGLSAGDLGNTLRSQGLVAAIELLRQHLAGLSKEDQVLALTRMFGGRQSGGVQILIDQLERLKTKVKEVDAGGQQFAGDWQAYTQTTAYKMDQLGASMQSAGISIGDILLPYVSRAVNFLSGLVQKFQDLSGPVKTAIVVAAGLAAALGPVITIVGNLVTVIGVLLTPVGALVAAVALLAGGIAAAVVAPKQLQDVLEKMGLSAGTSKEIVDALRDAFGYLKAAATDLEQAIRSHWGQIQQVIQGVVQVVVGVVHIVEGLWQEFGGYITAAALNAWNLVKRTIQDALDVIEGVVKIFAGLFNGNWREMWDGVKQVVSGVWNEILAVLQYGVEQIGIVAAAIGHALLQGLKAGGDLALDLMRKLPGLLLAALGDLGSLLLDAGKALVKGLVDGMESMAGGLVGEAKSLVSRAKSALEFWRSPPDAYGRWIGSLVVQGLTEGLTNGSGAISAAGQKTIAAAKTAIEQSLPGIQRAAEVLGEKATMSIVDGAVGVKQTMAQQLAASLSQAVSQAITQAQQKAQQAVQGFQSSFGSLASSILSAFSSQTSAYVSPAQKQLDAMKLQDQISQYHQAVQQAKSTLQADQQALTAALAGGDPATIQAAQQQVLTDTQAYQAAVRQQQEFHLSQLAAKQTAAYQASRAKEENQLAERLQILERNLQKEPGKWDTMTGQVSKLLKAYGVQLYQSGQRFVDMFANGLQDQIPAAVKAAKAMADAVAAYTRLHSPAEKGPLSTLDQWWKPFVPTLLSGLNIPGIDHAMGALTMPVSAAGTAPAAAGGGVTVQLTVNGYVGNEQQLVSDLSDMFQRAGRHGHPLWRGLAVGG